MGHVQASKIFHCLVWNEPAEKPKILLKTKSSGKTTFLWISNNITLRSQKNLSILVKSIKKNWGPKLGLNFPHRLRQRVIGNSHTAYNRTFHLYFLDAKFQLLGICHSQLYPEETIVFFSSWSYWVHFGGFGQ